MVVGEKGRNNIKVLKKLVICLYNGDRFIVVVKFKFVYGMVNLVGFNR